MAKKKKEKKGGKHMKKRELADVLINYFRMRPTESFSMKQLFTGLRLTTHPLKMLCADIVAEMLEENFLVETEKGRFKLNEQGQILTGTFQRKSNGKNSFVPDDGGEPIFIAERNSAHAMNGDKVKVALSAKRKRRDPEGQVIEILEHTNSTFVGIPAHGNQHAGKRYLHTQGKAERRKERRQGRGKNHRMARRSQKPLRRSDRHPGTGR